MDTPGLWLASRTPRLPLLRRPSLLKEGCHRPCRGRQAASGRGQAIDEGGRDGVLEAHVLQERLSRISRAVILHYMLYRSSYRQQSTNNGLRPLNRPDVSPRCEILTQLALLPALDKLLALPLLWIAHLLFHT